MAAETRFLRTLIGASLPLALVAHSYAQIPFLGPSQNSMAVAVGGKSSMDLITVRAGSPGLPLRHGGVIAGSEKVQLGSRNLTRGVEYAIDADSGVIYLMIPAKPGESVSVSYRYEPSRAGAGNSGLGGIQPFTFNLMQGAGLVMGLGLTERTQDGNVLSTNVFGLNNAFSFNGGSLKGLYLQGEKTKEQTRSMYEYSAPGQVQDEGRSQLIFQSLESKIGGGTLKLDYQDISSNFSAFSALRSNGYEASAIDRLARERGLTRMGASLDGLQVGGLGFSGSYRTVGEEDEGIQWQSFGLQSGGLKASWRSQKVSQGFLRFKDLAEADREQLGREAGLSRENLEASWSSGLGLLSFAGFEVADAEGRGIERRELKFDGPKLKFSSGQQDVETGFNRFDSLFEAQKGQWGRESGLSRSWQTLDTSLIPNLPLKFSSQSIESATGEFDSLDASISGKGWNLERIGRAVDRGFTQVASLEQSEIDTHIGAIGRMYAGGPGVPFREEERPWFLQSAGIEREFTRFTASPAKNWSFGAEQLSFTGAQDGGSLDTYALSGLGSNLSFRRQSIGAGFSELPRMLDLERQRLGTMAGIDRTDLGFDSKISKWGQLKFSHTDARTQAGSFARRALNFSGRNFDFSANQREVESGFTNIGQLLDPEAGLLAGMVGFDQSDATLRWQPFKGLRLEAMQWSGHNSLLDQDRDLDSLAASYVLSPTTSLEYFRSGHEFRDPQQLLFSNSVERMGLSHNFGKLGQLRLGQQVVEYAGTQALQPSSIQHSLAYETNLNRTTKFRTEQIRTRFDNGDHEDVASYTVATEIGRKAGISVTDTTVARGGDGRDEHKTNLGFWVTLWNGVRLNVGVNDQLNDGGSSQRQRAYSITPGTVGNLQIHSANYNENAWEQGNRNQDATNVSLATVKPFRLGFLEDLKINLGQDSASDFGRWQRDNHFGGLSGRVGSNLFGVEFRSQVDALERKAEDRLFTFSSDPKESAKIRVKASYKQRKLPDDRSIAIRNYELVAKPFAGFQLSHQLSTHPETPRPDLILGSDPQPISLNKWKLDYLANPNFKLAGSWEEHRNSQTNALSRMGGITLTLFEGKGSPLTMFYGIEHLGGSVPGRSTDRWSLRYDQKPGPNQVFSFFIGNVTYSGTLANGELEDNLTAQLEYQLKF